MNVTKEVTFPIYILAKDCGEAIEFSSLERMQRYLEPIDVENDEYEAWGADGRLLKLATGGLRQNWLLVEPTGEMKNEQEFAVLKAKAKRPERFGR